MSDSEAVRQLTLKERVLLNMWLSLDTGLTNCVAWLSTGMETEKAVRRTGLIRILKHILCNIDMRKPLVSQIDVSNMQKLIAFSEANLEFTQCLLRGLTAKELLRLQRLVEAVGEHSKRAALDTYTIPDDAITYVAIQPVDSKPEHELPIWTNL